MREHNYSIKIIILFLATGAGLFAIWYAMIREQSADWISAQVVHQVSPYAVTETDSTLLISNVVAGYEFSLPNNFKTLGARNLILYTEEAGERKCEIKHYYLNADKAEKLSAARGRLIVPWRQRKLVFEAVNQEEKNICEKYLLRIRNNLVFD